MPSSCSPGWAPDVFVSFRNDDEVSRHFKSDLCRELKQKGYGFRDTEAADNEAISQARFALVLLSTKYTDSSECLDELVEILNRRGESEYPSLVVIPIFLDPDQDLKIGKNLVREKRKEKWSWALAQVGEIAGYKYKLRADACDNNECVTTIIERLANEMQSLYSHKVFGPFGGEGEKYWHSGEIIGIEAFRHFIDSIGFQVSGYGAGRDPLKAPWQDGERITHFHGATGVGSHGSRTVIAYLTFKTNFNRRLETINKELSHAGNPEHFSIPAVAGKIIELFGGKTREGCLTSIGARVELTRAEPSSKDSQPVKGKIGAFGGGHAWDDGKLTGVKEIYLLVIDSVIRHIRFVYGVDGAEDRKVTHPKGAFLESDEKERRFLDCWEYLTSISGYIREDGSIQALTFYTNTKIHKRGDPTEGKFFGYPSTGANKIVGFHGTWGQTLTSIGAYVEPISDPPSPERFDPITDGSGVDLWNDGEHSHVIGYRVTASEDNQKIESVTFMYDDNGSLVEGPRRGGGHPSSGEWIMLNFPQERLISLTGFWRKEDATTIIHNLRLATTDGSRATRVYASREGRESEGSKPFQIPEHEGRRISGFFGRTDTCLNSIGAYVGHY